MAISRKTITIALTKKDLKIITGLKETKMKVYIVLHEIMDGADILGVFKNKEDAELTKKEAEIMHSCILLEEHNVIE
jgi:hypothetical protein